MAFNPRLLMSYLSSAGSSISQGESIAPALNAITQQSMGAESQLNTNLHYMKLWQDIIGGAMPGAKASADEKGMKLNIPSELIKSGMKQQGSPTPATPEEMIQGAQEGSKLPGGSGTEWTPEMIQRLRFLNPSAGQSGLTADDLVGLGPEQVSAALRDATDAVYKTALSGKIMNEIAMSGMPEPLDKDTAEYPIPHHAVGKMTTYEWKQLPEIEQQYSAYTHASKLAGDENIMTMNEFKGVDSSTRAQFLREVQEDPSLLKTLKQVKEAESTEPGPTTARLAMAAALGDETARRALELIGKTNVGIPLTPPEERQRTVLSAKMANSIMEAPSSDTALNLIDAHNAMAPDDSTRYFSRDPRMVGFMGDKAVQRTLPKHEGRQLTLGDVREEMDKHKLTFNEAISKIETEGPSESGGSGKTTTYGKPEDVKAAYDAGDLTYDEAAQILKEQFGLTPRSGADQS